MNDACLTSFQVSRALLELNTLQCPTTNRVSTGLHHDSTILILALPRTKAVFDSLEELNQMWGFAEDLESYEYVCKELLNYSGGTVSRRI